MEDKTIVCVDCSQPFVFTAGEQQFYAERGLTELPKRCKPCRNARRRRLGRRRRPGDPARPPGAEGDLDPSTPVEPAAAVPGAQGPEPRPHARTFWDDRPQWVREAMERAAAPAATPGNGAHPGNGRGDAAPAADPRRKRRRTRRRPRRGAPGALASTSPDEPATPGDRSLDGPGSGSGTAEG